MTMPWYKMVLNGALNIGLQYLVFIVVQASAATESMVGHLVAAMLQIAVITRIVQLFMKYGKR